MSSNWPGILVALAPFIVLAVYLIVASRRSSAARQEFVTFGRQSSDASQQIVAALKEQNALLKTVVEKLDRLERRP